MKSTQLNHEARDGSGIMTIAIILVLGFVCFGMTGLSYGANRPTINVRVADMQVSQVSGCSGNLTQIAITITDQSDTPVVGATVQGVFSGLIKSSVSGVTGEKGTITFQINKTGKFAFTVTDVSCATLNYELVQNMIAEITTSADDSDKQQPVADVFALPNTMGLDSLASAGPAPESQFYARIRLH